MLLFSADYLRKCEEPLSKGQVIYKFTLCHKVTKTQYAQRISTLFTKILSIWLRRERHRRRHQVPRERVREVPEFTTSQERSIRRKEKEEQQQKYHRKQQAEVEQRRGQRLLRS